jgi:PAS domain S-box-containing protein
MNEARILIVEDEAVVALDLKLQLEALGYRIVGVAASGEQAIEAVAAKQPQLVLMDVRLQGPMDGISAAQAIREQHDTAVIFLTSHSDDATVQRAARTAPYGYLTKPFQIKELRAGIEVALTKARMERQLREADRWFANTLQCVADGVIVTDMQGKLRLLNPAAERLTGWGLDDAVGKPVGEIVRILTSVAAPGPDAARQVVQVLREGRPTAVAHGRLLMPRAGPDRVVDQWAGPVNDDRGFRLGAVLVLRDAAPRLAHEERLRASEARFRDAFDFAPLGMALVSFSGEFIQVNDALCTLLARTRDSFEQTTHAELTFEADREHEALRLRELAASSATVVQFEKRYRRAPDGEPVWALVSVSMLRDAQQPSCHLYQVHDLSAQKAAAEHLAALAEERLRREVSELAGAEKTEFLSRASHEMRTPLNAVMGFAQLLQLQKTAPDPATVGTYADHIYGAGEHLLALVTDLLDMNRATQGNLNLQAGRVPLAQVVDEALRLIQGQAAAHGIELVDQVPQQLCVMADRQRLRQVLLNIASNAVKYNRQGGTVTVRAEQVADAVSLVVQDNGIGMTPEQLARLYQPFERLGAERTSIPGTGLGLVISRSLMDEMGGALVLQSAARAGTTVTLTLPAAP